MSSDQTGPDPSSRPNGVKPPPNLDGALTRTFAIKDPNASSKNDQDGLPTEAPTTLGRYEIRGLKGEGGFGAVYTGYDPQLQRQVAIKVPRFHGDQQAIESKFLQEARRLAQLSHPGIVTVYDVGTHDGHCYIVSDYLEGESLQDWLNEHQPDWQEATRFAINIAEALAYAHTHRTVHRDVKPDNIILKDHKTPVLIDFGLAISDESVGESERGLISGTPYYMSPEQAGGRGHRIDGRTDVYALGAVLYRMLCGRTPFDADDVSQLLRQVREDDPQPPRQLVPDLPAELERICLKALAKRTGDRYTTAGDMSADLRRVLETYSLAAQSSQPSTRQPDPETPTSELPSSARRVREAQRRQVTVMYCECELFDSAEFLENLDPEDQHEILSDYQQMCQDVVSQFGGAIVQSTGASLLVCFGYPTAYEDAARRAVHSGLAIRDGITQLNARITALGVRLPAWIGIHTGVVIAKETLDGVSPEPMSIVGEPRSVAAQLKVAAQLGLVIVTEATRKLIEGYFDCESLGEHSLQGASKPVPLHSVLEPTQAQTRIDVDEPSGLTPLVGRDMELGILRERWEQAAESMGQVVLLIGDAGLGKSRLVHEIRSHAHGAAGRVVEWRCSAYYQNSSFYPVIDFFERLFEFHRDDTPADRLGKLVEHLEQHNLATPEIVPLFASLLSVPLDNRFAALTLGPQRIKELTQQALLDWLRQYSTEQPILFIVEDLHWMDPTTLEFLGMLVDEGFSESILTVLTFRPEFSTPWTSKAHQTQIALNKLTKRQVGEMVRQKSGIANVPEELIDSIVNRTDGVPLFVEEFTNVIQESDALSEVDGQIELAESFSLDAIPNTLQDLLASRLDRMQSGHDVLQLGATLGREFRYELLNAVCDLDETTLPDELGKLVKAELLFQKGRPPQSTYTFKHALIQDAAYQSILRKQRQKFHKSVGEILQSQFVETAETEPELLAHHFTAAGEVLPGISYWLKAGQRSLTRCAVAEAMSHLQRGLELIETLEEGPQRDQLELGFQLPMGAVLLQAKGYANEDVGKTFARARELCERLGPEAPLFHVLWGLWVWNVVLNRLETCLEYADEMIQLAEQAGDDGFIMEARFCRGVASIYLGNFEEGRSQLSIAFERYDEERCNFHAQFTGQNCGPLALTYLALPTWKLGYPDQALRIGQQAVDLAKEVKHPFTEAFVQYHFGWLNQICGSPQIVQECGDVGHKISYEGGFAIWEALGTLNKGAGLLLEGGLSDQQAAEAMQQAQSGLQGFMATGAELHISHCYGLFAELFLRLGKTSEAAAELERGFETAEKYNEACDLAELHRLKGELLLRQSSENQAAAECCFQAAIETAREQKARSWELRSTMSLCRLWRSQGKREEARAQLSSIYEWFTEGFETSDLVGAKNLLDELAES
jgi:serine/threonine protein kinase/tetratricopeptide (TPR) repeat protein